MNEVKHGWYSEKQRRVAGMVLYATRDGGEVGVTMVTRTREHSVGWDDYVYVGEVTRYVRDLEKGVGLWI